ncbi:hypothetical protein [Bacterioplanoides sp.]|uniref:hypothetical protein n=1 Tax=Bacterioplanoides sp. TaxID=2066072 RepID=UPI003B5C89C5
MKDIIPVSVLDILRGHYALGIANAEAFYDQHSADEDSITGALGQALARAEPIRYQQGFDEFLINVSYKKIRGRGRGAPERIYGADGIFQLSVTNQDGKETAVKGLPFQSKKNWKGKNNDLLEQTRKMEKATPGGIVIDFSSNGYKACTARDVIASLGNRNTANRHSSVRSLEQFLSHDFLDCHIGRRGLSYNPQTERFSNLYLEEKPVHIITTEVKRSQWG